MSISSVINKIRKRPGMYLGSNSITALSHFLDGYQMAERDYDVCSREELFPLEFRYMHEFIRCKLNSENNLGWCSNILDFCNGDEEKALNKFFELFDEFTKIKMKRYWRAVLTKDNIKWNNSMEHVYRTYRMGENDKEPVFVNPIAVYVIELTIDAYILAVETSKDFLCESEFFSSFEQAKGKNRIPLGAEVYFGQIDSWEEFSDEKIEFMKERLVYGN
ncbi:MAG: hypothetical protein K2N34_09590 [Lachnospiraceae bacterium]|nr:hypothetical protein [Lachnospiraceae bacterium]